MSHAAFSPLWLGPLLSGVIISVPRPKKNNALTNNEDDNDYDDNAEKNHHLSYKVTVQILTGLELISKVITDINSNRYDPFTTFHSDNCTVHTRNRDKTNQKF